MFAHRHALQIHVYFTLLYPPPPRTPMFFDDNVYSYDDSDADVVTLVAVIVQCSTVWRC